MTVAVLGMRMEKGVSHLVADMVAKSLRQQMRGTGAYEVMTVPEMAAAFAEKSVGPLAECKSARCIAKIGSMLGVKKVVDGTIAKRNGGYAVSVRLVDVSTMSDVSLEAQVLQSSNEDHIAAGTAKLAAALEQEAKPVESTAGKVGFSEVITVPEGQLGIHFAKGVGLYKAERYEEALENLAWACEDEGGNENLYAEANAIRGLIYQFHSDDPDRYRKAYLAYMLALEGNPKNKIARERLYEVEKLK